MAMSAAIDTPDSDASSASEGVGGKTMREGILPVSEQSSVQHVQQLRVESSKKIGISSWQTPTSHVRENIVNGRRQGVVAIEWIQQDLQKRHKEHSHCAEKPQLAQHLAMSLADQGEAKLFATIGVATMKLSKCNLGKHHRFRPLPHSPPASRITTCRKVWPRSPRIYRWWRQQLLPASPL